MNDKEISIIEKIINLVESKLGVAVNTFWPSFIKKHILNAVVTFIWLIIWSTLTITYAGTCFHWPQAQGLENYDIDFVRIFMRVVGCFMCLATLYSISSAINQIKYLGNLKYWALRDAMKTFGITKDDE